MCSRLRWFAVLLIFAAAPPLRGEDGKLAEVREEVREKKPDEPTSLKNAGACLNEHEPAGRHDCEESIWIGLFVMPHELLGDSWDNDVCFARYPYADGLPGYLRILTPECREQPDLLDLHTFENTRPWSLRAAVEDGNDFAGLNRLGARLLFETSMRLGIAANWNRYEERFSGGRTDSLTFADVNLLFRFAQAPFAEFYAGAGLVLFDDERQTDYGWQFTYGANVFPGAPLFLSWQIDVGGLGEALLFHARGSLGACWSHGELFAGYDFLRIGTVDLQGPLVGVRLWF